MKIKQKNSLRWLKIGITKKAKVSLKTLLLLNFLKFASVFSITTIFHIPIISRLLIALGIILFSMIYFAQVRLLHVSKSAGVNKIIFALFLLGLAALTLFYKVFEFSIEYLAVAVLLLIFSTFLLTIFLAGKEAESRKAKPTRFWIEMLVRTLMFTGNCLIFIILVQNFVLDLFLVPSQSMQPAIFSGEVIVADKPSFFYDDPKRWDVAVVNHPGYNFNLLKRVIALPHEKLEIAGGNIWINDKIMLRPQNVLFSQMTKPPICYFDIPNRIADEATKHQQTSMEIQQKPADGKDKKDAKNVKKNNWTQAFQNEIASFGVVPISKLTKEKITAELQRWWAFNPEKLDITETSIRFKNKFTMVLAQTPKTEVLGTQKITDDLAFQIDGFFKNIKNLSGQFQSENNVTKCAYSFYVDFEENGLFLAMSKNGQNFSENFGNLNLDPSQLKIQLRFQCIDGLPVLYLNGKIYKPKFEADALKFGLQKSKFVFKAVSGITEIKSFGLFTPTFYFPYDFIHEGEKIRMPAERFFVLGDNSSFSQDSRNFKVIRAETKYHTEALFALSAKIPKEFTKSSIVMHPFIKREDFVAKAVTILLPANYSRIIN